MDICNSRKRTIKLKIIASFKREAFLREGVIYSFINLASIGELLRNKRHQREIKYFCDGLSMALLISVLSGKKISRVSFDFTSLAAIFFDELKEKNKNAIFVGGTKLESKKFSEKIQKIYDLQIAARSGYFNDFERDEFFNEERRNGHCFIVASMGQGTQEDFLLDAKISGLTFIGFTSGGFVSQEVSAKGNYYPQIINTLALRSLYRMLKEPHTRRRYLFDYPKNLLILLYLAVSGKLNFEVET